MTRQVDPVLVAQLLSDAEWRSRFAKGPESRPVRIWPVDSPAVEQALQAALKASAPPLEDSVDDGACPAPSAALLDRLARRFP